jgi:hypothetical protein
VQRGRAGPGLWQWQLVQWKYLGARQADWPKADFVVGNPPFIGAATMRAALGDGYPPTQWVKSPGHRSRRLPNFCQQLRVTMESDGAALWRA